MWTRLLGSYVWYLAGVIYSSFLPTTILCQILRELGLTEPPRKDLPKRTIHKLLSRNRNTSCIISTHNTKLGFFSSYSYESLSLMRTNMSHAAPDISTSHSSFTHSSTHHAFHTTLSLSLLPRTAHSTIPPALAHFFVFDKGHTSNSYCIPTFNSNSHAPT